MNGFNDTDRILLSARLKMERDELEVLIGRLKELLETSDKIVPVQRALMNIQLQAMTTYLLCLNERI